MQPTNLDVSQLRKRLKLLTAAFWVLFTPFLILFLLLGLPLLGNYVVIKIGWSVGCGGNAANVPPCYLLGKDISGIFGSYALTTIAAGAFNPILFIAALSLFLPGPVLILWITAIVVFWLSKRGVAHDLRKHG